MPAVIFVTAYDAYALRAFDVHALDYLLKPYSRERFHEALERVRLQLQRGADEPPEHKLLSLLEDLGQGRKYLERLLIKSSGRIFFLRTEEIEWVESEGNYLRLHAGHEKPLLRETMNNLAAKLDPAKFFRIHRSILVNIDSIKELSPMFSGDYVVLLYNGTELTLTRNYREKFLESFNNYT
jgi:two-component system LytT family response regulator